MIKLVKRKIDKWKKEYKDIMDEAKKESEGKTTIQYWKGQSKSEKINILFKGLIYLVTVTLVTLIFYEVVLIVKKIVN